MQNIDNEEKLEEPNVDNENTLEETTVDNENTLEEATVDNENTLEEPNVDNENNLEEPNVDKQEKAKEVQAKDGKNRLLIVFGAILAGLLACSCILTALGHWTDIVGLFIEEPAHEHSWNASDTATVKKASCTEDGLVMHICGACKEEEITLLPAHGHTLVNNSCVDCGEKASEGLKFTLHTDEDDNAYAVITGIGTCVERELIIPSVIGGLPVREIAENAFKGNLNIYSVSIPEGVKKIGDGAFRDCENLYTILLPESLEEFGALGAFHYTAYYNDEANWNEDKQLYRQGYLLEDIEEVA